MKKGIIFILLACTAFTVFARGQQSRKLVIWDKSEYVAAYNELNRARFEKFGRDNNVETEYVIVPHNDINSKVSAAIEARNPPDIIVVNADQGKMYAAMGELADISDVLRVVPFTKAGLSIVETSGGNFVIPLNLFASGMHLRKDIWDKHGLPYPDTWDDVLNHARIINDPANDFYALGYPMGASGGGDAESMVRNVVMSFGGIIVDKDLNVTVNSKESLAGINFIVNLYKEGLCPPSAVTWDDMGNNNAYMAGSVGLIHNTLSVFSQLRTENHPLYPDTIILPIPAGPAGRFVMASGNVAVVFKNGKQTELAKKFLIDFFAPDYYPNLVAEIAGMWVPVVEGAEKHPFWQDPVNKGILDSVSSARGPGSWPAPDNEITTQISAQQTGVKTIQKILLQNLDPQAALNEWEAEIKRILSQR